ncbi:MAG: hypothetical protein HOG49_28320 [Candidatus Scalindua sp.]|jgi:hypothetical protein|nr:hypothetical protein [Candidatus Scalindua sp.]
MNILFLTHSYPNYTQDFLLHGLLKLLGDKVVDYPKNECLYSGLQNVKAPEIYRKPFWFPSDNGEINRDDIESRLKNNYFDYVIYVLNLSIRVYMRNCLVFRRSLWLLMEKILQLK